MTQLDNFELDKQLLVKVLARPQRPAAQSILDTIAVRLFERLDLLKEAPTRIFDLGTGDGRHLSLLQSRFPDALVIGADLSLQRLCKSRASRRFWQKRQRLICLDATTQLPVASDSFDLVVSNMMLPWIFRSESLAAEINRVLLPDGAFFLSSAGPDTLIELRRAWAQIDDNLHVNAFMDMHDVGDMFGAAGIGDPVLDTERLTVSYPSLDALLSELIGLGFLNTLAGRRKGLTAGSVRQRLEEHYPLNDTGGVDATLELVVAHGWSGVPGSAQTSGTRDGGGEFYFPADQLRRK